MEIRAPLSFRYPNELTGPAPAKDPRAQTFVESTVVIDLRHCEFVRPGAVLWCVIYPLLARARGSTVRLLVPSDRGVCTYLKSTGLFKTLQEAGVDVDDRGIRDKPTPQLILPVTNFRTEQDVTDLANRALESLNASGLGTGNLRPVVSEHFAELALNAIEHSESTIGAYGLIQFFRFDEGDRFVYGVADGGIGIRRSLERNPALRERVSYDWDAIELAVRERVSGTGGNTRGIGLFGVADDMRRPGRHLVIHSGIGSLGISENLESEARRAQLFPGTFAYASIPA